MHTFVNKADDMSTVQVGMLCTLWCIRLCNWLI